MTGRVGAGRGGQGLRIAIWGGAALLMLAPVAATRLSDEMQWGTGDFVLVGAMLLAGCAMFELLMRKADSRAYRAGAAVALGSALLLFLVASTVGLTGSEDEPANLLYMGVIALGAAGAVAARLRPAGMARAMGLTAAAHVLAGIVGAILVGDMQGFIFGTALFTPLWLLSAWLFRKAAA